MFVMVLPAFGLPIRLDWAVLAMAITNLGIMVPSTPGYIGPFHYFCMQTLMLFGVASAVATSYAITVHAVFFVPVTLWGVAVVLRYGIEIGWIASLARRKDHGQETTRINDVPVSIVNSRVTETIDENPGQLVTSLVEAFIEDSTHGKRPSKEDVGETAAFVQGQINALPRKFRFAFAVGLLGFRVLVRARYIRSFCALPLEARQDIVRWWAFGP